MNTNQDHDIASYDDKCQPCLNSPNNHYHSTPISYHHTDNITRRKKSNIKCNLPMSNSFELLSDDDEEYEAIPSKSSTDYSYSSLPNTTTQRKNISCPALQLNTDKIDDLKERIRSLEEKLQITENELDNQLSENHALGRKILEYERKVAKLSHICHSPNKPRCTKTKRNSYNKTRLDFSRQISYQQSNQEHITFVPNTEEDLESKNNNRPLTKTCNHSPMRATSIHKDKNKNNSTNKANICILSSNKYNKTLSTIEDVLSERFQLIHYLKPNCGIMELLQGITSKLDNYTFEDYCVVFIGDEDFKSSKDYFGLVLCIKEALQKIQHTNIILCLPTYRFNKHIFNGRVESFNNMLYWDPEIHEYAYLLDTNLNLDYSKHLYRAYSGLVKSRALRIISEDLGRLILHVGNHHLSHPKSNYNYNADTFFRQDMLGAPNERGTGK